MGVVKSTLSEQDRLKLDTIVQKMVDNNEPEENIRFVVEDFKTKYSKKKEPSQDELAYQTFSGLFPNITKGLLGGGTVGSSASPGEEGTDSNKAVREYIGKLSKPKKVKEGEPVTIEADITARPKKDGYTRPSFTTPEEYQEDIKEAANNILNDYEQNTRTTKILLSEKAEQGDPFSAQQLQELETFRENLATAEGVSNYRKERLSSIDREIGELEKVAQPFRSGDQNDRLAILKEQRKQIDYSSRRVAEMAVTTEELSKYDPETYAVGPREIGRSIIKRTMPGFNNILEGIEKEDADLGAANFALIDRIGLDAMQQAIMSDPKLAANEALVADIKDRVENFDKHHPEVTAVRVKHKLAAELYKNSNQVLNIAPSPEKLRKIAEEMQKRGDLTPAEAIAFKEFVLPEEENMWWGTNIPMTGLINKFGEGFQQSITGITSLIDKTLLGTNAEKIKDASNAELETRFQDVGEYQPGKARLKELEGKDKLTFDEGREKYQLEKFVNVRSGWNKFLDGTGGMTGQVVGFGMATKLATGMLNTVGRSISIPYATNRVGQLLQHDRAGILASGFMMEYSSQLENAVLAFPSERDKGKRRLYAGVIASLSAPLEGIFDDRKIFAFNKRIGPDVKKFVSEVSKKGVTKEATKTAWDAFATRFKTFSKEFAKETGNNAFEEMAQGGVVDMGRLIVEGQGDFNQVLANGLTTGYTTALHSGLVAGMAAYGNIKRDAPFKAGLYQVAKEPTFALEEVIRMQEEGIITDQEATEKTKIISRSHQIYKELPAELATPEKTVYTLHRLNESLLDDQIAATTDEVLLEKLKAQRQRSVDIRKGIFEGEILVGDNLNEVAIEPGKGKTLQVDSIETVQKDDTPGLLNILKNDDGETLLETVQKKDKEKPVKPEVQERNIEVVDSEINRIENDLADLELMKEDPEENTEEIQREIDLGKTRLDELYAERELMQRENNVPAEQEEKLQGGIDQEEVRRQMRPITDKMAEIEEVFKARGYDIDWDYDNETLVKNISTGELVEPSDIPEDLIEHAQAYEIATQKLADFDQKSYNAELTDSRKKIKGEQAEFEVIENKKLPAPQKAYTTPSGKYTVSYENGKRVVKDKKGRVVPEFDVDKKTGARKANPQHARILLQHAKQYEYNTGEPASNKQIPAGMQESEIGMWTVENSENPSEIAGVWLDTPRQPHPMTEADSAIARVIGKVKGSSFKNVRDNNVVTPGMAKTYFNEKKGMSLDQVALSASDYGDGVQVTPEDVADFIVRFPNGVDPDGLVKTDVHRAAEEKFEKLTGIPLTSNNGRDVVARLAASQKLKPEVIEKAEDFVIGSMPDSEILRWIEEMAEDNLEEETNFNNFNTESNEQKTQTGSPETTGERNPRTESSPGQSAGGAAGASIDTSLRRDGSGEGIGNIEGGDANGRTDPAEEFRRELEDIGRLDDDEGPQFMAATQAEQELKAATNALTRAQRELSTAEDKIAKTKGTQQSIFGGQASQASMFSIDRDEAKDILEPLRDKVKEARAEVERLQQTVKDEQDRAAGQMSLFDTQGDSSHPSTRTFSRIKKAIEKMFAGVAGFKGVKVLSGKDFDKAVQLAAGDTMARPDGTIYGFVYAGRIILNGDQIKLSTPLHEASHLFTKWAKKNSPELFQAGQRLVATSPYLAKVKGNKFYQAQAEAMKAAGKSDAEIEEFFRDEALAFAVGDRGSAILKDQARIDFRNWLRKLWEAVKKLFTADLPTLENLTAADFSNMTFDELTKGVAERIISGEELTSKDPINQDASFMAASPRKGKRIQDAVQKALASGVSEQAIRNAIKNQGYSDDIADNILANAKRLPTFKPIQVPNTPGTVQAAPNDITYTPTQTWYDKKKSAFKKWTGRYFTVNKGMPEWMLPLGERTTGVRDLEVQRAYRTIKKLKDAAKKIGFTDWDKVDEALRSMKQPQAPAGKNLLTQGGPQITQPIVPASPAFTALPVELQPLVRTMRAQIDGLSRDLITNGYVTPEQALNIESNLGEYMNRAYAAHNQKNWFKDIPQKIKDDAANFLYHHYYATLKVADPTLPEADLQQQAKDMALNRVQAIIDGIDSEYNSKSIKTMKGRDQGILKQRQEIPSEIRALLGEFTDPGEAFIMTIAKMATLRGQAQFLSEVREMGIGTVFFEENDPLRPQEASVELRSQATETWYPLGGLFTTPEIAEYFNEAEYIRNPATNAWMKLVGAVRWGKTVGSVVTQVKNFESNVGFAIMNGHFKMGMSGDSWQYIWDQMKWMNGEQLTNETVDSAAKQGLIGQNVGVRELKEVFRTDQVQKIALAASTAKHGMLRKLSSKPGQVIDYLNKLYSASDDFFKIYGFVNERATLSKARFNKPFVDLSPAEQETIDQEAAERVKNTYPTYDRVWDGAKWLSKNMPVFGNFLSFQAESIRVLLNTFSYAVKDMKDPQMRAAGARRMVGIMSYMGTRYAILKTVSMLTGVGMSGFFGSGDDDEEQKLSDINRYVLPFIRSGEKLVIPNGPGRYTVYDITSLEPYGLWFKTVNSLRSGSEGVKDPSFLAAITQFLGPFGEGEMTAETVLQIKNNDNGRQGRIYDPNDPLGNNALEIAKFAWDKLQPSTVGFIDRMISRDNKANEIAAMFGGRGYDLDVMKGFSIKIYQTETEMSAITKEFYDNTKGASDEEIAQKAEVADGKIERLLKNLEEDKQAAIRLGANADQIDERIMKAYKKIIKPWDKEKTMMILSGEGESTDFERKAKRMTAD